MKVNGVDMEALINIASGDTSMNLDIARRRLNVDTDAETVTEVGQIQTENRAQSMYETTFETIEIGAFTLPNPKMTLMPDMIRGQFSRQPTVGTMIYDREEPTRLVDVTLGMSVLRNFHVYIAYGERKLYLSPAVVAAPQPAAPL